jgi:transposase
MSGCQIFPLDNNSKKDLQTHRPIDLLPERTADALSQWLRAHRGVLVMSRDRSTE